MKKLRRRELRKFFYLLGGTLILMAIFWLALTLSPNSRLRDSEFQGSLYLAGLGFILIGYVKYWKRRQEPFSLRMYELLTDPRIPPSLCWDEVMKAKGSTDWGDECSKLGKLKGMQIIRRLRNPAYQSRLERLADERGLPNALLEMIRRAEKELKIRPKK
jgi:hypothetical protein